MDRSQNKKIENLAVSKRGKKIKKIYLNHLNYGSRSQEPEPIYNVSKENFKSFVQQHTGSPNHPPHNPPNNTVEPNIKSRLQTIRPPPMSLVRPTIHFHVPTQVSFAIPTPVRLSFPDPIPIPTPSKDTLPSVKIIDFPEIPDGFDETSSTLALHPTIVAPQRSTIALSWDVSSENMVESSLSAYVRNLLDDPHLNGENVTTSNPIVSANPNKSFQLEPSRTTNSLIPPNISSNGNQLEPNGIPIEPSSSTSLMDIPFPSPHSPYGPLFPTDIYLPSPPSPPLFPPEF